MTRGEALVRNRGEALVRNRGEALVTNRGEALVRCFEQFYRLYTAFI